MRSFFFSGLQTSSEDKCKREPSKENIIVLKILKISKLNVMCLPNVFAHY